MQWGFAYWKSPWLTYTTPWPGDQGQHQQWWVILTVCTLGAMWWKVKVKVTQSCPTLCDQMNYTVHRILQARILEWVTFHFSRDSSQPRDQTQVSCIAGRFFIVWATWKWQIISTNFSLSRILNSSPPMRKARDQPQLRDIL